MKSRYLGALILVLAMALTLSACGGDSGTTTEVTGGETTSSATDTSAGGEPLVIGYAGAFSGEGAVGDVPARAGAEYAVELLNQAGVSPAIR